MKYNQPLSFQENNSILVFIDAKVQDYQSLRNGIKTGVEVSVLHPEVDGVEQITQTLSQYQHVESIHIISHGASGTLYLGNTELSLDTLENYTEELQTWFNSTPNYHTPALVLYGCNVAADTRTEFLEKLHQLTNANIYASSTAVGNSNLGGNWDLDVRYGKNISDFHGLVFQPEVLTTYAGIFGTGGDGKYTYYDSKQLDGKGTVSFKNISTTGTLIPSNTVKNDQQAAVDLPSGFTFNFYGIDYNRIIVGENGGIAFRNSLTAQFKNNSNLTSPTAPVDSIFPFWDGLSGGEIRHQLDDNNSNRYIIQWTNFAHEDLSGSSVTFQVVLNKGSNIIDFVYQDVDLGNSQYDNGKQATIGIKKDNASNIAILSNVNYSVANSTLDGVNYIRFIPEPQLITNTLQVSEGGTITLSSNNFNATDVDNSDPSKITYSISNLLNGEFRLNGSATTIFTQQDINGGKVQFIHNGSENAPSFNITLSDSFNTSSLKPASISFTNLNDIPVLTDTIASVDFKENALNAAASIILSSITLTDTDSSDFNGGNLTVNYSSGSKAEDQLSVSSSNAITFKDGNVSYNGNVFGSIDSISNGTGGKSLVVKFTNTSASLAAVKALIQNLTYQNTSDTPNASRTISITVNDGNGGTSTAVSKVINVIAENDAPVNTIPGVQNINEDDILTFTATNLISVSDLDAGNNPIKVRLEANKGTLSLNGISGLNFTGGAGDGTDDATLEFKGTLTDINKALNGMTFKPTANYNGAASVRVLTDDLGNSGADNINLTSDKTISININAINDAPVNTVPGAQSVKEDADLIFNSANNRLIQVDDVDVNENSAGVVQVNLSVTKGILTLASTTGITFASGNSNAKSSITFTGKLADVNKALDGLIYRGNANVNGADTLKIITEDLSNVGVGGNKKDEKSISITIDAVNDAPVNTVPGTQDVEEDKDLIFSTANSNAITVSDVDVSEGTGELEVTLSVTKGALTLADTTGVSFASGSSNGKPSITFRGTQNVINKALDGLAYRGDLNYNGADTLSIVTSDLGNKGEGGILQDASKTVKINVTAVNDAPLNTIPGQQSIDEDKNLVFKSSNNNAISVSDVDLAKDTGDIQVILSVTKGKLTLGQTAGLTSSEGNNSNSITLKGTQTNINKALEGLTYLGNQDFNGDDTLKIVTSDLANTGTPGELKKEDTIQIKVTAINDAPEITVPGNQSIDEDTNLALTGINQAIQVKDVDAAESTGEVEVKLSVAKGALTLKDITGLTFDAANGNGKSNVLFKGKIADINIALNSLVYRGNLNANGADTLTVTTSDLGNTGIGGILTDTESVQITINPVNDDPINTVPTPQTVDEDVNLVFSAANGNAISITDVDAVEGTGKVEVKLSVGKGLLTLFNTSDLTFTEGDGVSDSKLTFTGTVDKINQALNGLVYLGDQDSNSNANDDDTLTITTSDLGNTGSGGTNPDIDTITIKRNAINDAPVNTVPGNQSVDEDTDLALTDAKAIQIKDVDAAEGTGVVEVKLSVGKGILTLQNTADLTFDANNSNGKSTVVFRGTVANINTALTSLVYRGNLNINGVDTLTVTTSDLGNTGSGGILTDTDSFQITIDAVNDDPVIAVPTEQNVNEDIKLVFNDVNKNAITISDVDVKEGTGLVEVTLSVTRGLLTLGSTTGLDFTNGDGLGNATMTFKGTIDRVNQVLNGLTYLGNKDLNSDAKGEDILTISTSDLGNRGKGNILKDEDTVKIKLSAINDAPVNTVPGEQPVKEDTDLIFSTTNKNAITVSDIDVNEGTGDLEVTVGVTKGALTLKQTTGLTFSQGDGTTDTSMTFKGKVKDINDALEGLVYRGNQDFNGEDTLTINTNDLGNFGSGEPLTKQDTVKIKVSAVNDAPVNTVPSAQTVNEDEDLIFSDANNKLISISDVDVKEGTGELEVNLSVINGALTLPDITGINFVNGSTNNSGSITLKGTLDALNKALNGLTYRGKLNFNGQDTLSIVTSDNGNFGEGGILKDSSKTVQINVTAVNDAPVNTVPVAQTVEEDKDLVFKSNTSNAIRVNDVDAAEGTGEVKVTLSVAKGKLTLGQTTGVTLAGSNGSTTFSLTATQASINNALEGLTYRGNENFYGVDTLNIITQDLGNTGSPSELKKEDSLQITVLAINDAPINTVPAAQTVKEDTDLLLSDTKAIKIEDIDVKDGTGEVEVKLAVNKGTLTLQNTANLTFNADNGNGKSTVVFRGKLVDVNTALDSLVYRGNLNANDADTLIVTTSDLGNTGIGGIKTSSDTVQITIDAVNDAPVNTVPTEQNINEDARLVFSGVNQNAILVGDVDAAEGTGEVEVKVAVGKGVLTLADISGLKLTEGAGTANTSMTFTGSIDKINKALDGLIYQGTKDFNSEDTLIITTKDLGNKGEGGTLSDTDTVKIKLAAINDAPVNTIPGEQPVNEDTNLTFSSAEKNGITVSDIDVNEGTGDLEVTVGVTKGALTLKQTTGLTFSQGDGTTDTSMIFKGKVKDINDALEGLVYRGNQDFNGEDTLTINTNDLGNKGEGGPLTKQDTVKIKVSAVNDAPMNTVPGVQTVNEDEDLMFSGAKNNLISISDVDANEGTGEVEVTLAVNKGVLTLKDTAGLTFTANNTNDAQMTFKGKVADINKALDGLIYRGNKNYNGKDTLTITTNDLNNTGSGGSQKDIDTVEITLTPVNDPPVNADVPTAQSVNEDTSLIFNTANQNAIRISDVDVDGDQNGPVGEVQVTLAVTKGKVTLAQTTGLTFAEGSTNGSATVIVTGSVENINKAIDGLAYLGNQDFNGEETLTISINDKSNGGSGGELYQKDTVKINVKPTNDAPVNTVPSKQSIKEDTDLAFNAANSNSLSINDVDANEGTDETEVKLFVTKGVLILQETAGLTFKEGDGKGSTAISFTGKLTDINKALASLTYRGNANFHGQDTLTITTNDKGNNGDGGALTDTDTVDITVMPVNDAPVNKVPQNQKVDENKQLIFSAQKGNAISVSDIDASEGKGDIEVTLAVNKGVLTLEQVAGITFKAGDGKANATMTFTGKVEDINKALEGIVYQGDNNYTGQDNLTITTSDLGNFGSDILIDTDTIGISVIPDTDDDGISNSTEEEVASEIAKQNPTDINFKNLSQKAASDAGIAAIFGQDGVKKPIIIAINEQDQKQLGGTSQTPALVINVTTQRFNDAVPDPIAAFDSKDLKKSSLKKLTPVLDVINLGVMPNPVISEEGLQQKIKEGIKQKPVRVEIKLPDGLDDEPINTILNRKSDGTLYDFRRLFNPNRGELDYDALTGAVLQDRNLDGKADWAVVYLQDGNWGDEDGLVDTQIKHSLVGANWDLGTTRIEARSSNDGLNFYGNRSYVQFTLDRFSGVEASEVGMARVRFGSDGQIIEVNGKTVKSTEEAKQAIIKRGETLFSSLSKKNRNPDIGTQTRTVAFEEGEQAVFFVIQNGTKDELLFKGLDSNSVKFSLPILNNGAALMTASNDELGQTAKLSLAGLFDVSAKILTAEEARPRLGLLAIDQSQPQLNTTDELIDLKSSAAFDGKQVKLSLSLQREAAYDNSAYLYQVDDAKGSIRDPLTGMLLDPTSGLSTEQKQRYLELVTTDRLVQGTEIQASNLQTKEISVNLTGGEYYVPFLVSDGTLSSINKDFSRILTPYLGINSNSVDHIRSLGNNKFGFEDLIGGGDRDYNDMILSIGQVQIVG